MGVPAWIFAQNDDEDNLLSAPGSGRRHLRNSVQSLPANHPDASLISRVRAGDKDAFEEIYRTYFESLSDFAFIYLRRPESCGDIVNDVFANVWANRTRWFPEKGIAPYLRGAVRNRVRNRLRDLHRAERNADAWATEIDAVSPAPDSVIEARETAARIWWAVEQLPETRRLVMTLRWQQQLDIAEIASHLGISEGAVRVHLTRAMAQLRALLGDSAR